MNIQKNVLDEEGKNNGDVASVWLSPMFILFIDLLHENMLLKCFFSCLT